MAKTRKLFDRHFVCHASKDETWKLCLLYKVVGASSKTYDGGILLINGRTVHVLQVFGLLPKHLSHMMKVIGPHTCLWVFAKGEPCPLFAIGTPGINFIEDDMLRQFTAPV